MTEEKDFEDRMMEKFLDLFPKDKDGKVTHSECGVGCPEIWEELVESLCASIDYHVKNFKQYKQSNKIRHKIYSFFYYPLIHKSIQYIKSKANPAFNRQGMLFPNETDKNSNSWRNKFVKFLWKLETMIRPRYKWKSTSVTPVTIAQVKSKFNSLRFYYDGGDDDIRGMVRFAEILADRMFPLRKRK
jgi:hypothetical protein